MTIHANDAVNGVFAPYVGRNITNGPNLRAAQSFGCHVRWNTTSNGFDQFPIFYNNQADSSGIAVGRDSTRTGTVTNASRSNSNGLTQNIAVSSVGYGSTTAWVHMFVTYDTTNVVIFIDGVSQGSIASATTLTTSSTTCKLGVALGGQYEVADACFFSRVLTALEITELARRRMPQSARGDCFGWFPLLAGASIAEAGLDFSGKGNHLASVAGTGTAPTLTNIAVPIPYHGTRSRLIYVPASGGTATGQDLRSGTAAAGATGTATDVRSGSALASAAATGGTVRSGSAIAQAFASSTDVRSGAAGALATALGGVLRSGSALPGGLVSGGTVRSGAATASPAATGGVLRSGLAVPSAGAGTATADSDWAERRWLGALGARRRIRR